MNSKLLLEELRAKLQAEEELKKKTQELAAHASTVALEAVTGFAEVLEELHVPKSTISIERWTEVPCKFRKNRTKPQAYQDPVEGWLFPIQVTRHETLLVAPKGNFYRRDFVSSKWVDHPRWVYPLPQLTFSDNEVYTQSLTGRTYVPLDEWFKEVALIMVTNPTRLSVKG